MSETGLHISSNFSFVADVGRQCDLLAEVIKLEFAKAMSSPRTDVQVGQWLKGSYRDDPTGWVSTDIAYSIPLNREGETVGWFSFQVSLSGSGISFGLNKEPLIHVNFWTGGQVRFPDNCMGFPMEGLTSIESNVLLDFTPEGETQKSWTYSIRLTAVNNLADVLEKIVRPSLALLSNELASDALPPSLTGIAVYSLEPAEIEFQ